MNPFTSKIPKKYGDEHRFGNKYLNLRGLIFVVIGGLVSFVLGYMLWPISIKLAIAISLYSFLIIASIGIITLPESMNLIGYGDPLVRVLIYVLIHKLTQCVYVADLVGRDDYE